jgi:Fe-S cluster biogenesis protein NfuA
MFIQTEATPNPDVLKFLPGRDVLGQGVAEYRTAEEAEASPLAEALFGLEGVKRVLLGADFLTVTRRPDGLSWTQMKAPVLAAIMEHFTSGAPILYQARGDAETGVSDHGDAVYAGDTAQVVAEIKDLLDSRIRPAVAQDGGDITFDRFEPDTGVVWLHMRGACSGCPSSSATLKSGVENMLKHYVPEVTRVEQTL